MTLNIPTCITYRTGTIPTKSSGQAKNSLIKHTMNSSYDTEFLNVARTRFTISEKVFPSWDLVFVANSSAVLPLQQ